MTYDVKRLTERYAVTPHTVLKWIGSGELRAINVSRTRGGRPRWRITAEALDEFETARSAKPPPPAKRRRKKRIDNVIEFYPAK